MVEGGAPFAGSSARARSGSEQDGLDRMLLLVVIACTGITLLLVAGVHGHALLPALDLVIDTVALIVSGSLTAMAWIRFRGRRLPLAALQAAGFMALAIGYGAAVLETLAEAASRGVLSEAIVGQDLVFVVAQLVAATSFVAATTETGRRIAERRPVTLMAGSAAIVLVAFAAGAVSLIPDPALQLVTIPDSSGMPASTPFGMVVHLITAALFLAGAAGSRRLWQTGRAALDGWIAIGLVFAGFAELTQLVHPRAHPGHVAVADLMLLASSIAFLAGLVISVRDGLRDLTEANVALAELRDAEVQRAALEERTRLARELHDGLAQDLWLAKLRTGELASMPGLPAGARRLAEEANAAIDTGLSDAREAVAALRASHVESGLCALVQRLVEEHGDRYGLRAEYAFEGEHDDLIAARTQVETIRIAQEALTNIARHADATIVGVRLTVRDKRIALRIVDNGRGFDPSGTGPESYGLTSMRERASLVGGRLRIVSRVGAGTLVVLRAPSTPPVASAMIPVQ